ncbi:hypothetical protein ACIQ9P_05730 [Kitasatospora sp. NPDC094019]|uniref:hypothetical protein n=1 Tax=Kitasatospora sp. NPDC094019 TaxID=3364091 RepID=UPI003826F5E3
MARNRDPDPDLAVHPTVSEGHRQAATAHTDDARRKHERGQSAHTQITYANNANRTASRLRREGR